MVPVHGVVAGPRSSARPAGSSVSLTGSGVPRPALSTVRASCATSSLCTGSRLPRTTHEQAAVGDAPAPGDSLEAGDPDLSSGADTGSSAHCDLCRRRFHHPRIEHTPQSPARSAGDPRAQPPYLVQPRSLPFVASCRAKVYGTSRAYRRTSPSSHRQSQDGDSQQFRRRRRRRAAGRRFPTLPAPASGRWLCRHRLDHRRLRVGSRTRAAPGGTSGRSGAARGT